MARDDPQFRIRLPAELKSRIEKLAASNHRSLNAEIVVRLESSLQTPSRIAISIEGGDLLVGKTEREKELLIFWRELPEEKQEAFLEFIKPL